MKDEINHTDICLYHVRTVFRYTVPLFPEWNGFLIIGGCVCCWAVDIWCSIHGKMLQKYKQIM